MSTDRTKPKASTPRPLMPRLATYNAPSRSSPTPRLAVPAGSTPRPGLASSKSMSNLVHSSTPKGTTTPPTRSTVTTTTPRSTIRKPPLESTQSTPTGSTSRPTLNPTRLGTNTPLSSRAKPVVGVRAATEKSAVGRGPLLAKGRDLGRIGSPQTPTVAPRVGPPLQHAGGSFFHASDVPSMQEIVASTIPPQAASFLRANGEEDEDFFLRNAPKVDSPLTIASKPRDPVRPTSSAGLSVVQSNIRPGSSSVSFDLDKSVSASNNEQDLRWIQASSRLPATPIQHEVAIPSQRFASPKEAIQQNTKVVVPKVLPSLYGLLPSPNFLENKVFEEKTERESELPKFDLSSQYGSSVANLLMNASQVQKTPDTAGGLIRLSSIQAESSLRETQQGRSPESTSTYHSRFHYSSGSSDIVQSPPTSVSDDGRKVVDSAKNARRDRKVLDLEISNSSLLAINSTLEREVRRQKAELRRFRRLTRSSGMLWRDNEAVGRSLSLSGDHESLNVVGGGPSVEDTSEDDSLDGSSSDSEQSKCDSAKHRHSDIKMLQLDLAKHREILADSQKLNQSLGRCMGVTEQLIKEAKKALSYKVRTSDIQIGGRVLAMDEDYHDNQDDQENTDPAKFTRSPQKGYFDGVFEEDPVVRPALRVFSKPLSEVMREMF